MICKKMFHSARISLITLTRVIFTVKVHLKSTVPLNMYSIPPGRVSLRQKDSNHMISALFRLKILQTGKHEKARIRPININFNKGLEP